MRIEDMTTKEITPTFLALVKEYFEITSFHTLIEHMIGINLDAQLQWLAASHNVTLDAIYEILDKDSLVVGLTQFVSPSSSEEAMEGYAQVFVDSYTEEEMTQLVELYKTPIMQKVVKDMPITTQGFFDVSQRLMEDNQDAINLFMLERITNSLKDVPTD